MSAILEFGRLLDASLASLAAIANPGLLEADNAWNASQVARYAGCGGHPDSLGPLDGWVTVSGKATY